MYSRLLGPNGASKVGGSGFERSDSVEVGPSSSHASSASSSCVLFIPDASSLGVKARRHTMDRERSWSTYLDGRDSVRKAFLSSPFSGEFCELHSPVSFFTCFASSHPLQSPFSIIAISAPSPCAKSTISLSLFTNAASLGHIFLVR